MSEAKLYYTAPPDAQFDELKQKAMELWKDVDSDHDVYGYASEKINRIKDIKNVEDNFMFMVAMFDSNNQELLAERLSAETRTAIRERMIDGGNPEFMIPF